MLTSIPTSALPLPASRRISHGGMAFKNIPNLRQPQDGAIALAKTLDFTRPTGIGAEPEDASLTGSTRSLFRRAMGLNVMGIPAVAPKPAAKPLAVVRRPQRSAAVALKPQAQVA